MTVRICSCEGLNPKCEKCFGSGYINEAVSKKTVLTGSKEKKTTEKSKAKQESFLPENIKSLSRKEIENISLKIIDALDLKSKKQMQQLNSIPFSSTTFRRDFKGKFESLRALEDQKQFLRNELHIVKDAIDKKHSQSFKFSHFLSDKEIDVASNRQLKSLIREYKKQKEKAGSSPNRLPKKPKP